MNRLTHSLTHARTRTRTPKNEVTLNEKRKNDTVGAKIKNTRLFDISNLMNMMGTMLKTFSNVKLIFYVFFPSDFYHSFDLCLVHFLHLSCAKAIKCKKKNRQRERASAHRERKETEIAIVIYI